MGDQSPLEKWIPSIALAIFFVLLMVIMFNFSATREWMCGDAAASGRCFRPLIAEFQTLIGGLLAVVAALLTISKMQEIDKGQALRHSQLIEITLAADDRRLERVLVPQAQKLSDIMEKLRACMPPPPESASMTEDEFYRYLDSVPEVTEIYLNEAANILSRPQFKGGEDLFDGALTEVINRTVEDFFWCAVHIRQHRERDKKYDIAAPRADERSRHIRQRLLPGILNAPANIQAILDGLERLRRHRLRI